MNTLESTRAGSRAGLIAVSLVALAVASCAKEPLADGAAQPPKSAEPAAASTVVPAEAFLSGEVRLYGGLGDLATGAVHIVARGVQGTPLVAKLPVSEGTWDEVERALVLRFSLDGKSGMLAVAVPRFALPKTFDLKIAYTTDGLVTGIVDDLTIESSSVPVDSHDLRYELRPTKASGEPSSGSVDPASDRPPRRRVAPPEPIESEDRRR